MRASCSLIVVVTALSCSVAAHAAISPSQIEAAADRVDADTIKWRRDIHQHPELSNREVRTSALVAKHLKSLGLEVRTGIAKTGVSAILRGGLPGPTIALRADMDALPVVEETDVPFKSTVMSEYMGNRVGVMHACGHDAHTAVLMGVASALASLRKELPGTVQFIFQPAEEGPPEGEAGGASLMLEEGLFSATQPAAIIGLHVMSTLPAGVIGYRPGPFMAASDSFHIAVKGKQTHGSRPWDGIDPVVTAAQIVTGLQTIVSRQIDITRSPLVLSVGRVDGGVRYETMELRGTIRTFDEGVRQQVVERMTRMAEHTAAAQGASATMKLTPPQNPMVDNDVALTERILPSLRKVAGPERVQLLPVQTVAEDFSYYRTQAPSVFFFVGITPPDVDVAQAAINHSPRFYIHEPALQVATRVLLTATVDYLQAP